MDLKGLAQIQVDNSYTTQSQASLCLLYYPLIGKDAYILYGILNSFQNGQIDQEKLISLVHLNENQFDKARSVLEEFGLLKTYFNPNNRRWIYVLYAPLEPNEFLKHETFGRLFMNETGSLNYDFMTLHFSKETSVDDSFMDISKPLDVNRLNRWNNEKEKKYQQVKPEFVLAKEYQFDFDTFFNGMDRIFPTKYRTKENLSLIARLANVHGIEAKEMKKFVQRSTNPKNGFDPDNLKRQVMYIHTDSKSYADPYSMPPIQFMASKQNGAPVSTIDQNIIQSLCMNYPFSNEVVNVLIEYCLAKTDNKFNKSYVEKVAASWARAGVDSKEKALEKVNPKKKKATKNKELPDWYENTGQQEQDDDLLKKALEKQKQMKGE